MLVNELILDCWVVINGFVVIFKVGIRKVVLISISLGVSFRE